MRNRLAKRNQLIILIVLALLSLCGNALGQSPPVKGVKSAEPLAAAMADLMRATLEYKTSVEALLPIYERTLKIATESFDKQKVLYAEGIASKRDLERSAQAVAAAQAQLDEAQSRITESVQLLTEAEAEREMAKLKPAALPPPVAGMRYRATPAISRSTGSGIWSLTRAAQVQSFFTSMFGRQLPVSAYGQSATHNRLGFDHRNSMDVALHPDSPEGKALIAYLRGNGIPFIAFRSAVAGAATGAHIHIGYPSHRL